MGMKQVWAQDQRGQIPTSRQIPPGSLPQLLPQAPSLAVWKGAGGCLDGRGKMLWLREKGWREGVQERSLGTRGSTTMCLPGEGTTLSHVSPGRGLFLLLFSQKGWGCSLQEKDKTNRIGGWEKDALPPHIFRNIPYMFKIQILMYCK